MVYGGSNRAVSPARVPVTIKILIAGGFGVGKTTLVGSLTEIRPLRTEEPLSAPGTRVDRLDGVERKSTTTVALDFGRITIRQNLAIYLFGTYGTAEEWPESDVDIAVLLPPEDARQKPHLMLTPCHYALADALGKPVDLVNARRVSTVLQKEIVQSGRLLYSGNATAVAEFELLTLSFYQKLNEERQDILSSFEATGRAYAV